MNSQLHGLVHISKMALPSILLIADEILDSTGSMAVTQKFAGQPKRPFVERI